jgi:hypothetical protein
MEVEEEERTCGVEDANAMNVQCSLLETVLQILMLRQTQNALTILQTLVSSRSIGNQQSNSSPTSQAQLQVSGLSSHPPELRSGHN